MLDVSVCLSLTGPLTCTGKANLYLAVFTGSDETITMIMANIGSGKGWSHPIHLHGHYFWVLKMGYAQYDEVTAKIVGDNLDINCRGKLFFILMSL